MWKTVVLSSLLASVALAEVPEDVPVPLKFQVTGTSAKDVLLAGDLAVQPRIPASIERRAPRGPEKQSLMLMVTTLEDGRLLVRASWNEATADGETVKWEPAFIVKRAAAAEVRLDFPGGARVLKLSAG